MIKWGRSLALGEVRRCHLPRRYSDDGSATVEFIALTLILLVPLVYLVVTVGRVQAGIFAAQAGARDAARGAVVAGVGAIEAGASDADALVAADSFAIAATEVAVANFALGYDDGFEVELRCSTPECFVPGGGVEAHVEVTVPLPGVPSFLRGVVPLAVTVSADAASPVDGIEAPDAVGAP